MMTSKKEKDVQNEIEKALEHEENLQHDQNEEPVTFAKEEKNDK